MNINFGSLGVILAILVLLLSIILWVLGRLDPVVAGLIAALALARILP